MSNELTHGTPCFLVGLTEMQELNGHVVMIVSPVMDEELGACFEVAAPWVQSMFPGHKMHSLRQNLKALTPPDMPPVKKRIAKPDNREVRLTKHSG